ncbi:PB1 domain-containing protein tyrosine kinase [Raphanus sativus]|nr:PB1 domain-containing protein tyrosine kinase [Raphanus sativus]
MIEEYQEAEEKSGSKRIRVFLVSLTEIQNKNINQNTQHTDIEHYHYLSALNGFVDVSPQKSSSGKSQATTQFGTASGYSPTLSLLDSPTSIHYMHGIQIAYDLPFTSSAHKRPNTDTSYFVNPYGIYDNNFPFMVAPNLHGKWKNTEDTIGEAGIYNLQTKDFWREARILANLHHPNVMASYGVVPKGPAESMTTMTEFMVNGSLRHAL